ncbi:MAG: hypothetical protein NUV76_02485, partial [Candidatus Kuenenia sp.]|nr:hypothetical protein [Candidatus Kuenenia sp.]
MSKKPTRYSLANIPYSVYDTIWLPQSIAVTERTKNIDFGCHSIGHLDENAPELLYTKREIDTDLYMPKML